MPKSHFSKIKSFQQIPETEKVKLNAGSSGCEIIINEISSRNAR